MTDPSVGLGSLAIFVLARNDLRRVHPVDDITLGLGVIDRGFYGGERAIAIVLCPSIHKYPSAGGLQRFHSAGRQVREIATLVISRLHIDLASRTINLCLCLQHSDS